MTTDDPDEDGGTVVQMPTRGMTDELVGPPIEDYSAPPVDATQEVPAGVPPEEDWPSPERASAAEHLARMHQEAGPPPGAADSTFAAPASDAGESSGAAGVGGVLGVVLYALRGMADAREDRRQRRMAREAAEAPLQELLAKHRLAMANIKADGAQKQAAHQAAMKQTPAKGPQAPQKGSGGGGGGKGPGGASKSPSGGHKPAAPKPPKPVAPKSPTPKNPDAKPGNGKTPKNPDAKPGKGTDGKAAKASDGKPGNGKTPKSPDAKPGKGTDGKPGKGTDGKAAKASDGKPGKDGKTPKGDGKGGKGSEGKGGKTPDAPKDGKTPKGPKDGKPKDDEKKKEEKPAGEGGSSAAPDTDAPQSPSSPSRARALLGAARDKARRKDKNAAPDQEGPSRKEQRQQRRDEKGRERAQRRGEREAARTASAGPFTGRAARMPGTAAPAEEAHHMEWGRPRSHRIPEPPAAIAPPAPAGSDSEPRPEPPGTSGGPAPEPDPTPPRTPTPVVTAAPSTRPDVSAYREATPVSVPAPAAQAVSTPAMSARHATETRVTDVTGYLDETSIRVFGVYDAAAELSDEARAMSARLERVSDNLAEHHNIIGRIFRRALAVLVEHMETVATGGDRMRSRALNAAETYETAAGEIDRAYRPYIDATADAGLSTPSTRSHNEDD